jgi:hypothetical protein
VVTSAAGTGVEAGPAADDEDNRILDADEPEEELAQEPGRRDRSRAERERIESEKGNPSGVPSEASSSPVEKKATRRRRLTSTSTTPSEAISPSSAGPIFLPAGRATPPRARSSPARRVFCPSFWLAGTITAWPSTRVTSWTITVSAPAGSTAPVMMRTAWPSPTRPEKALPAKAVPTTLRRVSPSAARLAKRTA